MIQRRKKKIHEISILSKMATYVNVKNNITKEDSIENIANKLIQSSKVNINQFEEVLKEYNIKNKHVLNISNRYLNIQFNNIDRLEKIAK